MENTTKILLGIDAEYGLRDTTRRGSNSASDSCYLKKLGDWFRTYLGNNDMRVRLLRISEKVKRKTSYVEIGKR